MARIFRESISTKKCFKLLLLKGSESKMRWGQIEERMDYKVTDLLKKRQNKTKHKNPELETAELPS